MDDWWRQTTGTTFCHNGIYYKSAPCWKYFKVSGRKDISVNEHKVKLFAELLSKLIDDDCVFFQNECKYLKELDTI